MIRGERVSISLASDAPERRRRFFPLGREGDSSRLRLLLLFFRMLPPGAFWRWDFRSLLLAFKLLPPEAVGLLLGVLGLPLGVFGSLLPGAFGVQLPEVLAWLLLEAFALLPPAVFDLLLARALESLLRGVFGALSVVGPLLAGVF